MVRRTQSLINTVNYEMFDLDIGAAAEELLAQAKVKQSESYKDEGTYNEDEEATRRSRAMFLGYYAENGPTYDPSGKYLCGSCEHRCDAGDHTDCILVVGPISNTTGSCRLYEIGGAANHEDEMPIKYSQSEAVYTERPTVKGFGCSRCEYGDKAEKLDGAGRKLWCSFWGMHVLPTSCCERNAGKDDHIAPNKKQNSSSDDVDASFSELQEISQQTKDTVEGSYVPSFKGFTDDQVKELTGYIKNIPSKFMEPVTKVVAKNLGAIHGRYEPSNTSIEFNPKNFNNKMKFGNKTKVNMDQHVFTHEVGHGVYRNVLNDEQRNKWSAISGWIKGTGENQAQPYEEKRPGWPKKTSKWTHNKDAKFTRLYSEKNPNEDFADHFAYYVCGNEDQIPEEKRNFLKDIVDSV